VACLFGPVPTGYTWLDGHTAAFYGHGR